MEQNLGKPEELKDKTVLANDPNNPSGWSKSYKRKMKLAQRQEKASQDEGKQTQGVPPVSAGSEESLFSKNLKNHVDWATRLETKIIDSVTGRKNFPVIFENIEFHPCGTPGSEVQIAFLRWASVLSDMPKVLSLAPEATKSFSIREMESYFDHVSRLVALYYTACTYYSLAISTSEGMFRENLHLDKVMRNNFSNKLIPLSSSYKNALKDLYNQLCRCYLPKEYVELIKKHVTPFHITVNGKEQMVFPEINIFSPVSKFTTENIGDFGKEFRERKLISFPTDPILEADSNYFRANVNKLLTFYATELLEFTNSGGCLEWFHNGFRYACPEHSLEHSLSTYDNVPGYRNLSVADQIIRDNECFPVVDPVSLIYRKTSNDLTRIRNFVPSVCYSSSNSNLPLYHLNGSTMSLEDDYSDNYVTRYRTYPGLRFITTKPFSMEEKDMLSLTYSFRTEGNNVYKGFTKAGSPLFGDAETSKVISNSKPADKFFQHAIQPGFITRMSSGPKGFTPYGVSDLFSKETLTPFNFESAEDFYSSYGRISGIKTKIGKDGVDEEMFYISNPDVVSWTIESQRIFNYIYEYCNDIWKTQSSESFLSEKTSIRTETRYSFRALMKEFFQEQ